MKITTITPEQTARFPEWVKKWTDIGLSTEETSFDKARDAVLRAYELCGLKKPKLILHLRSPLEAVIGGPMALTVLGDLSQVIGSKVESHVLSEIISQIDSQVDSQIYSQVESHVWSEIQISLSNLCTLGSEVFSQIDSQVFSQILSQVGSQIEPEVVSQIYSQVESEVGSRVYPIFSQKVGSQVRDTLNNNLYMNSYYYIGWASYISFIRDILKWKNPVLKNFEIIEDIVLNSGGVWWHEDVAIIMDRPQSISRDNQGRLHNETGPSIRFRDGFSLWSWRGVKIPSEWITDRKSLTPMIALHTRNAEQRQVACEMIGWTNILKELNAKIIDVDDDPEIGTLLEVDLPELGIQRFLQARCGTGRTVALCVPRDMQKAIDANAWSYHTTADILRQKEHRT